MKKFFYQITLAHVPLGFFSQGGIVGAFPYQDFSYFVFSEHLSRLESQNTY